MWIRKSLSKMPQGLMPQHQEKNKQRKGGLAVFGVEHFGTICPVPRNTESA